MALSFAQTEALNEIKKTGYYAKSKGYAGVTLNTIKSLKKRGLIRFDIESGKYVAEEK